MMISSLALSIKVLQMVGLKTTLGQILKGFFSGGDLLVGDGFQLLLQQLFMWHFNNNNKNYGKGGPGLPYDQVETRLCFEHKALKYIVFKLVSPFDLPMILLVVFPPNF